MPTAAILAVREFLVKKRDKSRVSLFRYVNSKDCHNGRSPLCAARKTSPAPKGIITWRLGSDWDALTALA
jgi:hypothetical protein